VRHADRALLEVYRELVHAALAGQLTLGMLGVTIVLGIALVAVAARARTDAGRGLSALVWASGACLAAALALAWALAIQGRRWMLHPTDTTPSSVGSWIQGYLQANAALFAAGLGLAAFAVLAALATAIWHARAPADPVRGVARFSAAVLLAALGVGAIRSAMALGDPPTECGRNLVLCLRAIREASDRPIADARLHVVALAVLGTAAAAFAALARRRRDEAQRRGPALLAALTLAAGGLAFLAARPMAADAALPSPGPGEEGASCADHVADTVALPPEGRSCEAWRDGPVLEVRPPQVLLDGSPTDAEAAGQALKFKRELWKQVHPGKTPSFAASVAAPPSTPTPTIAPYLAAIRDNLGPEALILVAMPPRSLRTETLGDVPLARRCCGVRLSLAPPGKGQPVSAFPTWGDLATAAESPLALAP
jgi:hypothetical protein